MKGLDRPTVVMVLHINKDHSEVSLDVYRKMVQNEFLFMLRAVSVPIELSIQGEDVSFLATANPSIVEEMRFNPRLSVLRGSYTHAMPSFFPGTLQSQISLSNKVLKCYLGKKLSGVGCLPEVDVSTPIMPYLKTGGWTGALVLEDLHYTYEYKKDTNTRIPLTGEVILRSEGMPLIVAADAKLRDIYLKFYRGFATPEEFIEALETKAINSKANFAVFFIDFEVPQVNAVDGQSRLDLWRKLFGALAKSSIRFCHFQDAPVQRFIKEASETARETQIDSQPMSKWHHSTHLYEQIEKALANPSADIHDLLRLTVSDTFSAIHYWPLCAELPVKDSEAKVIIKPDLTRRIAALDYFLAKTRGEIPKTSEDPSLSWYLNMLEKAHKEEKCH